ncbi:MAG: hypothetical protein HC887_01265, partial [Desulfobacteraceae bacterium]|nr:hypothetical protein [Desulfobacteraceae bacterium]
MNLFHKTVKLAPDKKIFSEQLRLLLNHMAMDSTTSAFELQIARREREREEELEKSRKAQTPAEKPCLSAFEKKIL